MCKLSVDTGICGFKCGVEVRKKNSREAVVNIQSDCAQVSKLNEMLGSLDLSDIFIPPTKNIVFTLSEKAGCHASCPVPLAVLKCAEVEMDLALPRHVFIKFES